MFKTITSHMPTVVITIALLFFSVAVHPALANHGGVEEEGMSHSETAHTHTETTADTATMKIQLDKLQKTLDGLLVLAKSRGITVPTHVTSSHADTHAHGTLHEVTKNVPSVSLEVHEGEMGGYAVHLDTTNFTFAPLHADTDGVDGEGHAHIYVDGVKISRVYAPWYYLAPITAKGTHTISVELSTNDHKAYAHDGEKISDSVEVVVK